MELPSELLLQSGKTLGASLVLLAISTSLAVFGAILRAAFQFFQAQLARRKSRRQALVDLAVYIYFVRTDWGPLVAPDRIDAQKAMIDAGEEEFRFFLVFPKKSAFRREMEAWRHSFDATEMARIEAFLDLVDLFEAWYGSIASEAYGALSRERKKNILDVMVDIHGELDAVADLLREEDMETGRMIKDLRLDHALPRRGAEG